MKTKTQDNILWGVLFIAVILGVLVSAYFESRASKADRMGLTCINGKVFKKEHTNYFITSGLEAVCVANVIKYLWRYEAKGGLEDVKKAQWYLERLIKHLSKEIADEQDKEMKGILKNLDYVKKHF